MLKTRIIGVVLVKNKIAVQSLQFKTYLPIGKPEIAISYLDRWGVDEIVVLNLDGAQHHQPFTAEQISLYAKNCHVPLAIGGGIRDIESVKSIIRAGADKIVLNTAVFTDPMLVNQSADLFGQQCVVVSLDAKKVDHSYATLSQGKISHAISPIEIAKSVQAAGAGEIFLTSADHDGCKQGYDLNLIKSVTATVSIPVIACGGAGQPHHAYAAMQAGASAVAVGNCFHFIEHSVILFKKTLAEFNAAVRHDSYVSYKQNPVDKIGRLLKHEDELLNKLRFQYIPEEMI